MDKHHIKNGDIAQCVLQPKLIVPKTGRAGICNHSRRNQRENGAGEQPEIRNVKQRLRFGDRQIAAKNDTPAADCNGQMVNGVWIQFRNTHQPPKVRHLGDNQSKCPRVDIDPRVFETDKSDKSPALLPEWARNEVA